MDCWSLIEMVREEATMLNGCIIIFGTLLMMIVFTGVLGFIGGLPGIALALILDLIMLAQIPGRMRRARARREWFRRTGFPGFS